MNYKLFFLFFLAIFFTSEISRYKKAPPPSNLTAQRTEILEEGSFVSGRTTPWSYQRIGKIGMDSIAEYGFSNFNGDRLTISYQAPAWALKADENSFGYEPKVLKGFEGQYNNSKRLLSHKKDNASRLKLLKLKTQYSERVNQYMASHGFKVLSDHVAMADIPLLVRENTPLLKHVAKSFAVLAQKNHYSLDKLLGAVTSLVQIGMIYRNAPLVLDGRQTAAILPPPVALADGWGNCASKTVIAASILLNWPNVRLIGINPPGHYLFGILRLPKKGDFFVRYKGLPYVLVEAAGPAWLSPGLVYDRTADFLKILDGFRVEPFS